MCTSTSTFLCQIPYSLMLWGLLLKATPKQPGSSADIGSHASKKVTSWSDLRYAEKHVNKTHIPTWHSLPFSKSQMGAAWRNEQPSSGLVGQTQSDEGTCAGSPPAWCFFSGAVGPHQSWRNLSLNAVNKTSRIPGREESLAVPVPAHCGVPQHPALGGTVGMGECGSTPRPPSDTCTGFVLNTNFYISHTLSIFLSLSKCSTLLAKAEPDPECSGEDWTDPQTCSRNILLRKMRRREVQVKCWVQLSCCKFTNFSVVP